MARAALNTQMQQFMTESYVRERDHRLRWYMKNQGITSSAGPLKSKNSRQTEVFKKQIESAPKTDLKDRLPKDYKAPTYHRKKPTDDFLLELKFTKEGEGSSEFHSDMAPPTKSQTQLLFDGFSKEGKGRYAYLTVRKQTIPEQKFRHPTLSSWDIGWHLDDYIDKKNIKKPKYGRTCRYAYLTVRKQTIPEQKFRHPTLSSWDIGWHLDDYIDKKNIKKPKYGRTCIVKDSFYTRNGIPDHD